MLHCADRNIYKRQHQAAFPPGAGDQAKAFEVFHTD